MKRDHYGHTRKYPNGRIQYCINSLEMAQYEWEYWNKLYSGYILDEFDCDNGSHYQAWHWPKTTQESP